MTAKQYLSQIRHLDTRINQRIREKELLQEEALSTGAIRYDKDRVQTSPSGTSRQLLLTEKAADMELEITRMIDRFVGLKHKIIGQIQQLPDERFMRVLFERYVNYKSFEQIAVEMSYTYKWICDLHGMALNAFDAAFLKQHEQTGIDP